MGPVARRVLLRVATNERHPFYDSKSVLIAEMRVCDINSRVQDGELDSLFAFPAEQTMSDE